MTEKESAIEALLERAGIWKKNETGRAANMIDRAAHVSQKKTGVNFWSRLLCSVFSHSYYSRRVFLPFSGIRRKILIGAMSMLLVSSTL